MRQKIDARKHIASTQRYENIYEDLAICPVLFLLSIKTINVSNIHLTHHSSKLSTTGTFNQRIVVESLTEIQTVEKRKRRIKMNFC